MDILFLLLGLAVLLIGGELLVRGGVGLAARLGLSPAVIGAVVLGFGTSMPELVTSVQAAMRDAPGIAVGNVLGSNIANILLILGLTVLVVPIARNPADRGALVALLAATAAGVFLMLRPELGRLQGAALIAGLAAYILWAVRSGADVPSDETAPAASLGVVGAFAVGGLACVIGGAHLLVDGATSIARSFGISETVIGLTLVAVGTSLPELATSAVAAWRGQGRMALGNILGSNVFNILGILGITALVVPIPVPTALSAIDLVMFAASAALLALCLLWRGVGRAMGVVFVLAYAGYIAWLAGLFA